MAGDWIKMRADLLTHPKVVRMASALKADRLRVVGGLFAVWCLFDAHSVDGQLEGYTDEVLDSLVGFPGFAEGMRAIGWLEFQSDSLVTPRFDEHNGQSAKRRATEAQRKRDERKTSASDADKKRTREEKRREEKSSSSLRSEDIGDSKYPAEFEIVWNAYPDRPGASKAEAFKAWSARLRAGASANAILAGVERYAAFCKASATEKTFIKQPATFFGPGEHYLSDWTPVQRTQANTSKFAGAAKAIWGNSDDGRTIDA